MSHLRDDEKQVLKTIVLETSNLTMENKQKLLAGCEFLAEFLKHSQEIVKEDNGEGNG